jgi:hypothetical protein
MDDERHKRRGNQDMNHDLCYARNFAAQPLSASAAKEPHPVRDAALRVVDGEIN